MILHSLCLSDLSHSGVLRAVPRHPVGSRNLQKYAKLKSEVVEEILEEIADFSAATCTEQGQYRIKVWDVKPHRFAVTMKRREALPQTPVGFSCCPILLFVNRFSYLSILFCVKQDKSWKDFNPFFARLAPQEREAANVRFKNHLARLKKEREVVTIRLSQLPLHAPLRNMLSLPTYLCQPGGLVEHVLNNVLELLDGSA